MYNGDTFFHLSAAGQTGLALLSGVLAFVTLWCFCKISSRFGALVKVLLAFVALWIFTWVSPQAYYFYYWLLFDRLPMQNVLQFPPRAEIILRLITFTGPENLSAHSKGILFWLMIAIVIWKLIQVRRQDRE